MPQPRKPMVMAMQDRQNDKNHAEKTQDNQELLKLCSKQR